MPDLGQSTASLIFRFEGATSGALGALHGLEGALGHLGSKVDESSGKWQQMSTKAGQVAMGAGLAITGVVVGVGAASVKMASDWQSSMTQLVTGAGESKSNIDLVSKGLLDMSTQVGVSAQDLASGMYMVESAGFHGAQGLDVMKAAAMGAKVGNADMSTVTDALTSAMNAYKNSGLNANQMTNALIATVANGKMHMQDLASSLGSVLPAASAAGVSLQDVSAAIATMTAQGTPASDAATYLRQTLLQLENPSAKAQKALKDVGMSSAQLHDMLANPDVGLQGTLSVLSDTMAKKFGYGTQQYIAHLADAVGGTRSMQAALELTGPSAKTYANNLLAIGHATAFGKDQINGWSDVQQDFNFKLDKAKATGEKLGITLGTALLPVVSKLADKLLPIIDSVASWIEHNQDLAGKIFMVIAALGAILTVLGVVGVVVPAIVAGVSAFGVVLGVVLSPIGLVVIAVALLVAGIVLLITHWKQVHEWLEKHIPLLAQIMDAIGALKDKVVDFAKHWKQHWDDAMAKLDDAKTKVQDAIKTIEDKVNDLANLPGKALTWGEDMITSFITGIKNKASGVADAVKNAVPGPLKNLLGFSGPPPEGPLADSDQWMPHFMDMLTSGIQSSAPKLQAAMAMAIRPPSMSTLGLPGISSVAGLSAAGAGALAGGGIDQSLQIHGMTINNPSQDVDIVTALQRAQWLARMQERGIGVAPQRTS